jgi:hypothetical protein
VQKQIEQHSEDTGAEGSVGGAGQEVPGSQMRSGPYIPSVEASLMHSANASASPPPVPPRRSPRQAHLDRRSNALLPEIPPWAPQNDSVPAPLPRRPPAVPAVPSSTTVSFIADCPQSLQPFSVEFGAETARHLGINCGLQLGGSPDLAQYSCCLKYFVRMEDGSDGPAKSCGKVRQFPTFYVKSSMSRLNGPTSGR